MSPYRNKKNLKKYSKGFFGSRKPIKIITKAYGFVEGYFLAKKIILADFGPTQVQKKLL